MHEEILKSAYENIKIIFGWWDPNLNFIICLSHTDINNFNSLKENICVCN